MSTTELGYVRYDAEDGVHIVSGHEEIAAILRGPGWSSDPRRNPRMPAEIRELPPSILLFLDPPEHTRLRRLVAPAFTPRGMHALRESVAVVVEAALDQLEPETDLVTDFAYVVPLAVIADFLGVGDAGAEVFRARTPAIARMLESAPTTAELAEGADAALDVMMYLTPVIADRRRRPGPDFISALLAAGDLSLDEVAATCVLLLGAGHETTANLLGSGARAILDEPAQRAPLLADPARAIEELLRLHGPVRTLARTATTDHRVGGYDVPAGAVAVLRLDLANVDPRRYRDPHRLDLSREPVQHLAFGGGAHFCLGAALTRLEATIALPALFERYPRMRAVDALPDPRESTTFRGPRTLRLRLE